MWVQYRSEEIDMSISNYRFYCNHCNRWMLFCRSPAVIQHTPLRDDLTWCSIQIDLCSPRHRCCTFSCMSAFVFKHFHRHYLEHAVCVCVCVCVVQAHPLLLSPHYLSSSHWSPLFLLYSCHRFCYVALYAQLHISSVLCFLQNIAIVSGWKKYGDPMIHIKLSYDHH